MKETRKDERTSYIRVTERYFASPVFVVVDDDDDDSIGAATSVAAGAAWDSPET